MRVAAAFKHPVTRKKSLRRAISQRLFSVKSTGGAEDDAPETSLKFFICAPTRHRGGAVYSSSSCAPGAAARTWASYVQVGKRETGKQGKTEKKMIRTRYQQNIRITSCQLDPVPQYLVTNTVPCAVICKGSATVVQNNNRVARRNKTSGHASRKRISSASRRS